MTQRVVDTNGWFEVKRNPLSRVGVFPYSGRSVGLEGAQASQVIRVFRPEEELADPECIESFKLLPWVDEHTMLGPEDGMTPAEVKGVAGVIGEEVFYDSGVLYGNIKAFSNSLGRLIEAGKTQLSAGYRCVYDWTAGIFNGQPYDCVQRQIRGNHLALVTEGRMGPSVAVMDSLVFTFDAQEAIAMADPKENEGGSGAGDMTLAQVVATLGELAPQVAKLQEAFSAMGGGGAAVVEDPDAALAGDKAPPPKPAAAAPAPAAATPVPPQQAADVAAAMDAALKPMREQLAKVVTTMAAMDAAIKGAPAAVAGDFAARDKLVGRLSRVVGTFDASDKTAAQVAAYGCEKLGLKPAKGAELVALDAYLSGVEHAGPTVTVRTGMDAAPSAAADNFVARQLAASAK